MTALGLNFDVSGFSYTVLDGNKTNPSLVGFGNTPINNFSNTQQLMSWYETTFQNLITQFNPSVIGIKVSLNATKEQIPLWYYPIGLLHNISYQKNISVEEFVYQNFTASKFGLPKTDDIYDHIDSVFGIHKPKWSKNQKYSVLSAWMVL